MKPFRRLLADRSGAFAMVAIIAQLLVVQMVAAGYACAGMDAAAASDNHVICQGEAETAADRTSPAPGSPDCCVDCLGAVGCGQAPSILAPTHDANGLAAAAAFGDTRPPSPFAVDALGSRAPPPGLAYKRGPPFPSV